MPTPTDVLQASLEKHNATFEALLNLIPAKYYLVQQLSEEQASSSCGSTLTYQRFNTGLDVDCFEVPEEQQETKGT